MVYLEQIYKVVQFAGELLENEKSMTLLKDMNEEVT